MTPTCARSAQYPLGTHPDRNWRRPAFDFGKNFAPCGVIEYKGDAFPALKGKILIARYSGGKDIIAMTPAHRPARSPSSSPASTGSPTSTTPWT